MPEISQPVVQTFMISTVYVGMPLGRGAVGPWVITMSDVEHLSAHILFGCTSTSAESAQNNIKAKIKRRK